MENQAVEIEMRPMKEENELTERKSVKSVALVEIGQKESLDLMAKIEEIIDFTPKYKDTVNKIYPWLY